MEGQLFVSLDTARIVHEIMGAERSACYAAPGIRKAAAEALAALGRRIGPELITVCLDFDERVMRMGFGELSAVKTLRGSGINVRSTSGLRTGLVIVDDHGYIFTPTALYLEADERLAEAPNAMRLSKDQVTEALARLSPAAKTIAIFFAETEEEKKRIGEQAVEVPSSEVTDNEVEEIGKELEESPPVPFDIARQVRVFSSYLQYVELRLSGAAIQRQRLSVPPNILKLGGSKDLDGRLKTTIHLIDPDGELSSKALEDELNELRKNFTPSLGKDHGRVLLKRAKPVFEERLDELRSKLKKHQERVERELQDHLNASQEQIVEYYLPRVVENPPDALLAQIRRLPPTKDDARYWLNAELDKVFPKAKALIQRMQLDVRYKDVTYETLNSDDFLDQIKAAFPRNDWEKAYEEFRAAGVKVN